MPLLDLQTMSTSLSGNQTSSTVTPKVPAIGTGYNPAVAFTVTTAFSDTAATGTVAFKIQGTVDGSNYVDVFLLPSDSDTAAGTFTKTSAASFVYFAAQSHVRKFSSFKMVLSSNTNMLVSATSAVLV